MGHRDFVEPRSLLWTVHTSWPFGRVTHVVGILSSHTSWPFGLVTHVVGFGCPFLRVDSQLQDVIWTFIVSLLGRRRDNETSEIQMTFEGPFVHTGVCCLGW